MAHIITRQRKITRNTTPASPKTRLALLQMLIAWGLYVCGLIAGFTWLRTENAQTMVLFRQSNVCEHYVQKTPIQEICREQLTAKVSQIFYIYGGDTNRRLTGRNEVTGIDLDLLLPDGGTASARISKGANYPSQAGKEVYDHTLFYFDSFKWIEKGEVLSISRWRGKIIAIQLNQSSDLWTVDHPVITAESRISKARAASALVLMMLVIWSSYTIVRRRR